jgi:hypothetical protein
LPALVARSPLMSSTAVKAFSRDFRGGVHRSYFLLDAETIGGKVAGNVKELARDDVSDSTNDCEGEDACDGDGEYGRDAPGLKAADGRGQ